MKDWFKDWFDSPYYHLLYNNRSEQEAQNFVKNTVEHFGLNNTHSLLDLACGKGRHSVAFAAFGIDVTGVDLAQKSIAFAQQVETETLHFYVHDMRHTFRTNYYDMVCNLFTSFGYFNSSHENMLAATSMFNALKKGGTLLVDFVNRSPARRHIEANAKEQITRGDVVFDIERSFTEKQFIKKITIHDQGKTTCFQETLNSFSKADMVSIFTTTGLQFIEAFGNYQFEAFDEEQSPRMILVFRK